MFKVSNLSRLLVLFAIVVSVWSCKDDAEDTTITAQASADAELSSLVTALARVDLDATLRGDGPFTVFAPTNAAFDAFLTANGFASLDEVPDATLTAILLNHVVSGENRSTGLSTGYVSTLSPSAADPNTNLSMFINTSGGVRINGVSDVTTADISASNGVIHKVNAVIGLPTVVTHAVANPEFANLVAALTSDGTSIDYVATLSGTGPFTVFAPNNAAFSSFVVEKGFAGLTDIPLATLETVLQYHVVTPANVNSSSLTNGQVVETLEGTTFTVNLDGGATITDNESRTINIIATDVQANNGIVHVVDRVLSPL